MKICIRVLLIIMSVLILSGCGRQAKTVPPQPLGTLAAIEYSRRVDMVWGENYSIRVNPEKIESIEFFVEQDREYSFGTDVPLDEGVWQELEVAALELLPGLTEITPKKESLWKQLFKMEEPFLMDGADSSVLSFDWKTEDGIISVNYNWNHDDPKMQELISLLKSLERNVKGE